MEIFLDILKVFGVSSIPVIVGVVLSALILWGIAERISKPGTEVSVLWGLVKYVKQDGKQHIPPPPFDSPSGSGEVDVARETRSEALSLLGVTRSTPGGLWLAAESVTTPRASFLLTSKQIKPEHRAEALAHLSLALTVFNKARDAREVAEDSLSAALDVHDTLRSYTYNNLTEKFLEANLTSFAQQAAECALDKARTNNHIENFRHVMQIYTHAFSPDKALVAARTIQDPKSKSDAMGAIISYYIEEGTEKEAAHVIEEALVVSQKISKTSDRAHAYYERAREWMQTGRYEEAANIAKQAKKEAQQINPQELFGELARKSITNDMAFLEAHPLAILKNAEAQRNPYLLTYLAKFLPKRGQETVQIAKSAVSLATQTRTSDALADAAQMLDTAGLSKEAQQAAQRAMDLAMNAADHRFRDTPLQKVAAIFSRNGNYESALSASMGISTPKYGAETMVRVLISSYARTGKISSKAADAILRLRTACATLNDKDRSAAMMQLATSMAFLGNLQESYQTAKQSPLSGHRLSAYAIIMLVHQMQNLPVAETAKIHNARGDMFEKMLLPILGWDLAN